MPSRRPAEKKLATYQRMRDFARTPEPAGGPPTAAAGAPRFVVQRHRASRLHYDLRFEIDGVLASWAVPKGPTLDPGVRRAAFHVEDHPIEYIDFEGVIPSGEYGGGDVIVWDTGTYELHKDDDAAAAVAGGELHVEMYGAKLRGRFVLVRTRTDRSGREEWLLLHKHDDAAQDGWDAEDHPQSVLSGRTNDEVKADPDRLWRSDLPAGQASVALRATEGPDEGALDRLDALGASGTWSVYGRELRLSDLDKVLVGGAGRVTKRDLVRYAAQVAPVVLPHLARRAVGLHRFPSGLKAGGRMQRTLPARAPEWLSRWEDAEGHPRLVIDEPAALVWAAGSGALEWYAEPSTVDDPDRPTYATVELDPGRADRWDDVLVLARLHRTAFDHLGLTVRPMLTGRGGLLLRVPIAPGPTAAEIAAWVSELERMVGETVPDVARRRWVHGSDADLLPYSPRAAAGAPVAAPLEWAELDDPPERLTVRTTPGRLAEGGDPFAALLGRSQRLPALS